MPFNTSGIFNRVNGLDTWQKDAAAGTKIEADLHDASDNDIANSLSDTITKWGWTLIENNIPWNGKKITNIGPATADTDVPQYAQVKNWKDFSTGINLTGTNANGRITFTGTGVNGINWTVADLSWLAKPAEASKALNRLVMNDSGGPNSGLVTGGTGTDVFIIDDGGRINNSGALTNNLSWDGAGWRTISPGTGTKVTYIGGNFTLASNDTATITNPYVSATQRQFFAANNSAGSSVVSLAKSASGKECGIRAYVGSELRWNMQLGNTTTESGTAVGSDFVLAGYNNSGASLGSRMFIKRDTGATTFYGPITADGSTSNITAEGGHFIGQPTYAVLAAAASGGAIYLRPNGMSSSTEQCYIDTSGTFHITNGSLSVEGGGNVQAGLGLLEKTGRNGAYGTNTINFNYAGGFLSVYADDLLLGNIAWQSDYRIKRDITPLGSMWDKVKSLNPVSYKFANFKIFKEDGIERWGFVAHELQEQLLDSAANGRKDEENVIQSPNPFTLIAALTKALQEAMTRIEALEARA